MEGKMAIILLSEPQIHLPSQLVGLAHQYSDQRMDTKNWC